MEEEKEEIIETCDICGEDYDLNDLCEHECDIDPEEEE